jgi:hypothetical protein
MLEVVEEVLTIQVQVVILELVEVVLVVTMARQ